MEQTQKSEPMTTEDVQDEEEEILVLVELAGIIDNDFDLKISDNNYKVLGIDTDNPVIQIGHNVFSGEYHDTPSSLALFEEKPSSEKKNSAATDKELELKYIVQKKLIMKRAFLSEKCLPTTSKPKPTSTQSKTT